MIMGYRLQDHKNLLFRRERMLPEHDNRNFASNEYEVRFCVTTKTCIQQERFSPTTTTIGTCIRRQWSLVPRVDWNLHPTTTRNDHLRQSEFASDQNRILSLRHNRNSPPTTRIAFGFTKGLEFASDVNRCCLNVSIETLHPTRIGSGSTKRLELPSDKNPISFLRLLCYLHPTGIRSAILQ